MTIYAHIDVALSPKNRNQEPVQGNVKFEFYWSQPTNPPLKLYLDKDGTIYIKKVPSREDLEITFHLDGKTQRWNGKEYEMKFLPSAAGSARELLWIVEGTTKPLGEWTEETGFKHIKHNVDDAKSSIRVVISKSELPANWTVYTYDLAVNVRQSNSAGIGDLVRHDPQIKNRNPTIIFDYLVPAIIFILFIAAAIWTLLR